MIKNFSCSFFQLCETFFANFFNVSKGSPSFFFYFAKEWMFKTPKGPPFPFFGTMRVNGDLKKNFPQFLVFREVLLSLVVEKMLFEQYVFPLRYNLETKKIQNFFKSDFFFNFFLTRGTVEENT